MMYTCEIRDNHLFVEITEPFVVKMVLSTIQEIADTCKNENLDKVLVDMRAAHEPISTIDRYTLGVKVANVLGPKIKVAVVAHKDILNHVAENVAVNRYGKLKGFFDIAEATDWLGIGKQDLHGVSF